MSDPSQLVTREIMGNVPSWLAWSFYGFAFASCALAAAALAARWAKRRRGRKGGVGTLRKAPWRALLARLAFHDDLLRDRVAGIAHLMTFYGFVILFIGTCLVFLEHDTPLHFFYGRFYQIASAVIDLGGVAFLAGLSLFLWRRHVTRPARLLRAWWVAACAWLLLAIGVSGFLLEAARIAIEFPQFEVASVVGYPLAKLLARLGLSGASAARFHRAMWGGHAALCVAFFALLPWKFFSHMVYAWMSRVLRRETPHAALSTAPLSAIEAPGASAWPDFTRLDLLHADACTTCGRCTSVCPAHAAGKPLSPREIVLGVRQAIDQSDSLDLSTWIDEQALWSCTTCAACNEACPVGIDVYGKIIEMRRGRVELGVVPEAARRLFEAETTDWNPFGRSSFTRTDWAGPATLPVAADDEPIELLYWVGCAGSFDPEGQSVAKAMIKILNHAKIPYRVLGNRERCTGDPARRLGEEGLFQELATCNLQQFKRHGVRRIVTHCPHCFNTIRNEYPALRSASNGGDEPFPEVVHHTQFLAELVGQGRLRLAVGNSGSVAFHDPCYLGRGNGIIQAPRDILQRTSGDVREMPRHGRNSFCCGAGGGGMWVDVAGRERVENLRAEEAARTGAATVATACPFCKVMLTAGRPVGHGEAAPFQLKDIAELVCEAEGL
ncbi:MAG: (Fe-S)-binding protein [Planctomycetaceae bacterium]